MLASSPSCRPASRSMSSSRVRAGLVGVTQQRKPRRMRQISDRTDSPHTHREVSHSRGATASDRCGCHIAEDKPLTPHHLAGLTRDRLSEDRPCVDEGVELPVLTTGVDARGQLGEQAANESTNMSVPTDGSDSISSSNAAMAARTFCGQDRSRSYALSIAAAILVTASSNSTRTRSSGAAPPPLLTKPAPQPFATTRSRTDTPLRPRRASGACSNRARGS